VKKSVGSSKRSAVSVKRSSASAKRSSTGAKRPAVSVKRSVVGAKRSAAKKVRSYYICVIMISVLFSFWYFFLRPAKEAEGFIVSFFENFNEESKAKPESFLADTVNDRSFIAYCRDNPQIRFEIATAKRRSFNTFVTSVRLQISGGSVPCSFHIVKTSSGYKITSMPRIDIIKSCLHIMSEVKGNQVFHTVDIAGKSFTYKSLPAILPEENQPSSITLLDDTIIRSFRLTCVEAKKVLSVARDRIEIQPAEATPIVPVVPDGPDALDVPIVPGVPPDTPGIPDIPDMPDMPDVPDVPDGPPALPDALDVSPALSPDVSPALPPDVSPDGPPALPPDVPPATLVAPILPVDSVLHVYEMKDGSVKYVGDRAIPPGTEDVKLYLLPGGKAVMAIYPYEKLPFGSIRVAIGRTGFSGLVHEKIVIGSDEGFTVSVNSPDQSTYGFDHSQKAVFTRKGNGISVVYDGVEALYTEDRLYITPKRNGAINLYGIERAQSSGMGYTCCRGAFEISPVMDGISIVNEISLEEYLGSVVSSEMPAAFGPEALKAQAVAARTYAVKSILRAAFSLYGANIDDSTASQVYNNVAVKKEAVQAVEATRGLVLFYDGQLADTRYFSTSCGYTASSNEVWEDSEGNFPGKYIDYLSATPQFPGKPVNLSNDSQMKAFLNLDGTGFYDSHSPYFRWEVTMTGRQAEAVIRHNLDMISEKDIPQDIGRLMDIKTMRRGSGGNIIHLLIKTTSGEYNVYKELNIRRILQPVNRINGEPAVILRLNDGSIRENFQLLPSSFAVIETVKDKNGYIDSVTIKGGGFGHGAGMSQYGAYGLALSGYPFEKILLHYYPGTELKKMY
jgi:stage II sporulation protein D